jgi:hypothetical protein
MQRQGASWLSKNRARVVAAKEFPARVSDRLGVLNLKKLLALSLAESKHRP